MRKSALAIALAAVLLAPSVAYADITAFFSVGHRPETRTGKGIAVGLTLVAVGFEVEYSDLKEKDDPDKVAPRLRTGTVNAIVQTPTSGAQLYATAGVGLYRENWRLDYQETSTAINIGGGLKMGLLGPVKLRVDYRYFRLNGTPLEKSVHRVYGGLNASF